MAGLSRFADLPRRWRTGVLVGAALALAGVCALVATTGIGIADTTRATPLAGQPIPAADLPVIIGAATSCPALTAPRLASQLMAASGFSQQAVVPGGSGVAALSDPAWQKWMPWSGASRADDQASIFALAHQTCDLIGQVRLANVAGDPWQLALAADRVGLPAVVTAGGVPTGVSSYVDTVARYAAWYADQPAFGGTGAAAAPLGVVQAQVNPIPLPDAYVTSVRTAGHTCALITPPAVAAQLMVESGFDPNRLGVTGAQGIAQFLPEVWARYAGSATASPWDATAAIVALGRAMCDLTSQLGGVTGDPYQLALAAYQWGSAAVHQAGGVPASADLSQFIHQVVSDTSYYASDPRLAGTPTPGPSGSRTANPTPTGANGLPVPDAYVALINSSGHRCTGITAARLAAQLSVESKFDPSATAADGAQGIAMFQPAAWILYRATPTASALDPAAAIPAAAHLMCDLLSQVSNAQVPGDGWHNALAAYHWGLGNVINSHGVPAGTEVSRYIDAVVAALPTYQKDSRLH